ncbi:MAG: rRNA-binding ribosome biosynthesis protein utp25 [Stictis urceolatum]|nr:rRNA-binding ribosome biosynthesis protein utp25 [Stictis urceolata]
MATFVKHRGARGSNRSRGRGGRGTANGHRSKFFSTRVQDLEDEVSDGQSISEEANDQDEVISSESSDDEVEVRSTIAKPYSALLQSLSASTSDRKPTRKRQKLSADVSSSIAAIPEAQDESRSSAGADNPNVDEADEAVSESGEEPSDTESAELSEDGDANDSVDLFESHFNEVSEEYISKAVTEFQSSTWKPRKSVSKDGFKEVYVGPPETDSRVSGLTSTKEIGLKQRLRRRAEKALPSFDGIYEQLAGAVFGYRDVLFCERTSRNAPTLRYMTSLHILNHVLKTRDRVIKNNMKLAKADNDDIECRDQGFTRPKVLCILPTRQSCARMVESIVSLYEPEQQENKKRFLDAYSRHDESTLQDRPEDFRDLFAGHDDDMFRIGMKFTRKTVKFFSQFYNSDILFASPLGLRNAMEGEKSRKEDYDFLSSIELVIVDHCDAILMQNWEHVEYAFKYLNMQPKEAHGCDFGRVRNWYLDGNAKYLRQTIITTAFNTPEVNKLYARGLSNIEGKVKINREPYNSIISELGVQLRQTFSRFDSGSPNSDPDDRFKFFTTIIVPNIDKSSRIASGQCLGILLYIPSYFDFVRVRNFLAASQSAQNVSFGSISEYTPHKETARARSHFITGRHSVLLYTGRAHHFNRLRIRGCKKIIFYSLPENPIFYKEIAGDFLSKSISEGIVDPNDATSRAVFSRWDALKLERIVGSTRIGSMLKERAGDTFDFL